MTPLRVLLSRLLALFMWRRPDADLHDEILAHLDLLAQEHVRSGMSAADARAAARREFGGVDQIKETYRDHRGLPFVETAVRDVRHALRNLRRSPIFTTVALVTFALGIGATTAVFAIFNSVLLRPLPYPNASHVVQILQTMPAGDQSRQPGPTVSTVSDDQLRQLRAASRTLAHVSAYLVSTLTLTGAGEPVRVNVGRVSAGFFEIFGVRPVVGRSFTDVDEQPGGEPVVVLSHRSWDRQFGRDVNVVGRTLTLDGRPQRIVGVMAEGFNLPSPGTAIVTRSETGQLDDALELWMPRISPPPLARPTTGFSLFTVVASIAEGVTPARATAELNVLLPPLPNGRRPVRMDVSGLREQMVRAVKPTLTVFQVAVLFVLLIACANVANLLLARASHRRRELAIRLALGASRLQAARGLIVECLLLAVGGSLLGSFLAMAIVAFVHAMPAGMLPRLSEIRLDAAALGAALALSLTAGVIVGAFVAARVLRSDSSTSLRSETVSTTLTGRPSQVLVVVQVAAALVLLGGAGLLLNSFVRLVNRDLGFETGNVLSFRINVPPGRYPQVHEQAAFWGRLVESLARLPGVEGVAAGTVFPFQQTDLGYWPLAIAGHPVDGAPLNFSSVAPGYFQALRIPVLSGREFTSADGAGSPPAVIISRSFAARYFGSTDPVGREVRAVDAPSARVIGVVPDTPRSLGMLPNASPSNLDVYYSAVQPPSDDAKWGHSSMMIAIRTTASPAAIVPGIRRTLTDLDTGLAVYDMATFRQRLSEALAESRLYGAGAGVFALVALFLAVIGLYGVMAYSVGSRTQEWGIRMALGADPFGIVRHVLGHGLRLTTIGILLGAAGVWFTSRFLRTLLFGVQPNDPVTLVGVAMMFLIVAGAACYVPARRASRVDPMVALRHE